MDAHTAHTLSVLDWKRVTRFTSRRWNKRYYNKYCTLAYFEKCIKRKARKKKKLLHLGMPPHSVHEKLYIRSAQRLLPPLGYTVTLLPVTYPGGSVGGPYKSSEYFVTW